MTYAFFFLRHELRKTEFAFHIRTFGHSLAVNLTVSSLGHCFWKFWREKLQKKFRSNVCGHVRSHIQPLGESSGKCSDVIACENGRKETNKR
ncbi:hypothetical protein F2P81_008439 [Scophthalmus maximus]|uniref:Uncharacterized protein n=1 Tax=Scophthalmus maximus TaxID=52904 RepID=A0A6A4TAM8_SCOMX|nr:hypothetical protein F2P81_008439 [Scophthalmus maximus]